MKNDFIYTLSHTLPVKRFLEGPLPKWIVFAADVVIVFLASWITLHFNANATPWHTDWLYMPVTKALAVVVVYAICMFIFKSYQSVVRLSTFHDTFRVALVVSTASVALIMLEAVLNLTVSFHYLGIWSIFVLGVLSFSMLVTMRLAIKYLFNLFDTTLKKRRRVVVLGSAINSFAMASALLAEVDGRFNPVLMLSIGKDAKNGRVNGIPIKAYNPETVGKIFADYDADTLIFLSSQLDFIRNESADVFLSNHIRLLMLNQIEEFDIEHEQATLSPHVQDIKIEDLLGRDPIVTHNPTLGESLRDKTVMITGAAGSIGSELVVQVASHHPGRIVLVDQAETPMHELQLKMEAEFPNVPIQLCIADIVNLPRMTDIFDHYRPQIIYHAAAYKHVPMMERNPQEAVQTNVFGTKNIADLSMRFGVERFVMISTDKAVNPTNIMGASKRIAEIYVQSLALSNRDNKRNATRFITTRFGNVLGSNGSVIPLFRKQIANGGPVTVTHRDIIRYFMTIPEAVSLVLEAGCMGDGGEIYIFDMGKPVKIYDLATRMISLAGLRPGKDIQIVETGLRPGEKLYEELLNNHEHTIATHHKKIMIAKVRTYDYNEVCQRLATLHEDLDSYNIHDIVASMKHLVPEFKSQNSAFSTIDSEIKESEVIHEIGSEN